MQTNAFYNSEYESRETGVGGMKNNTLNVLSSAESSKEQAERDDYLRKSLKDADNLSSKSDGSSRSKGSRHLSSKDSKNKKIKKKSKKNLRDQAGGS